MLGTFVLCSVSLFTLGEHKDEWIRAPLAKYERSMHGSMHECIAFIHAFMHGRINRRIYLRQTHKLTLALINRPLSVANLNKIALFFQTQKQFIGLIRCEMT